MVIFAIACFIAYFILFYNKNKTEQPSLDTLCSEHIHCDSIEYGELIFFSFGSAAQQNRFGYHTVLYEKKCNKIRQIRYIGEIRAFAECEFFPDTAWFGSQRCGERFADYRRLSGFEKLEFDLDTLSIFYFSEIIPIRIENPETLKNEEVNVDVFFERSIIDTVFNNIYHVKNCKKYVFEFLGYKHMLYVDIDRGILAQVDYKIIDLYNHPYEHLTYKVVFQKDISKAYFEELWNKSESYSDNLIIGSIWWVQY